MAANLLSGFAAKKALIAWIVPAGFLEGTLGARTSLSTLCLGPSRGGRNSGHYHRSLDWSHRV